MDSLSQRKIYDQVYDDDRRISNYNEYHLKTFFKVMDGAYFLPALEKYLRPGAVVVDLGSGGGNVPSKIRGFRGQFVNMDISYNALKYSRGRLRMDSARFVQADMNFIPLRDGAADVVICYGSLHHVSDLPGAAREIGRVLKKDGVFIALERLPRFSWFELWMSVLPFGGALRARLIGKYKQVCKLVDKKVNNDAMFDGIDRSGERHSTRRYGAYVDVFGRTFGRVEARALGLEFIPPRFFELPYRLPVRILFMISTVLILISRLRDHGMFILLTVRHGNGKGELS
jgi:ubiquinone/menaquinone biosynthesis C-methylase UbiE